MTIGALTVGANSDSFISDIGTPLAPNPAQWVLQSGGVICDNRALHVNCQNFD